MINDLNEAIWNVINSKFKKDAPESFKIVAANGYDVYKNNYGHWTVRNPKTYKAVYLSGNYINYGRHSKKITNKIKEHFDFVRCLSIPINNHAYSFYPTNSNALDTWNSIRSIKWRIDYQHDQLEKTRREIARLQNKLVDYARSEEQCINELNNLRRKVGLIK